MIEQDPRYERRAARLVEHLRGSGIEDERILDAFARVPRHLFIGSGLRHRAYRDEALPIGLGQTISQPYTVAYQTRLLDLEPGSRVLEVGTGSGYQAAILCAMGMEIFSIERHARLQEHARSVLDALGCVATLKVGDGTRGWPAHAPFDAIVVTAGAARVPDALRRQLRPPDRNHRGGRLVIPVGAPDGQTMVRITRVGDEEFSRESFYRFRFVPLVSPEDK